MHICFYSELLTEYIIAHKAKFGKPIYLVTEQNVNACNKTLCKGRKNNT